MAYCIARGDEFTRWVYFDDGTENKETFETEADAHMAIISELEGARALINKQLKHTRRALAACY